MKEKSTSITDICALVIYGLINVLFVYKYSSRIISQSWAASLAYIVIVSLLIVLLFKKGGWGIPEKTQNSIYFFLMAFFAVLLTFLMIQFDPQQIRVGRYPAMYDWITKLLSSEFPYASFTNPSGFPFLFVMAMPFYFLGDLGFFQIFSFLVFALLVYLRNGEKYINRFRCILLLVTAPIFLYEIVVRSELFSNMVMVMLYLAVLEAYGRRAGPVTLFFLGIIGGLLLSTRGVVLLIYIIVLGYFLKRQIVQGSLFFISMFVGFFLSLAPFLIWDWKYFLGSGPFAVQLSYIPNWLLTLAIASSVLCALTIRSLKGIYSSVSFILFGVISVAFVLAVFNMGWHKAVFGSGFDIAYFCFALPYLLISLEFAEKGTTFPERMFVVRPTGNGVHPNASKGGTWQSL